MFKIYAKGSLISDSVFLFWFQAKKNCEITIILNFLTSSKCLVHLFNKYVTSYKSCLAVGYFLKGIKEVDVNDELNGHQAKTQKRGIRLKQ